MFDRKKYMREYMREYSKVNREKMNLSSKNCMKRKRKLDPLYRRKTNLKYKYGLTLEQYDKMFEQQNGNCAICGLPELMKRLAVDHNHETGKIRGLLCGKCNTDLGVYENRKNEFKEYLKN